MDQVETVDHGTGIASCPACRHYIGALTCKAFPTGIPDGIVMGLDPHTTPHKGDHGVRFEPMPEGQRAQE